MRNKTTRLAGALLAAAIAVVGLGFVPTDALAKKADEGYTYTVRLYAGNEGTIENGDGTVLEGGKVCEASDRAYNGSVTLAVSGVTAVDGYYVRGVREAGKDELLSSTDVTVPVTGDADYVVAYAVKSDSMVDYTVSFVDANGAPLIPSATYSGAVGDVPVVAATYIAGYEPRQATLTDTLGEGDNAFTFVYDAIPENVVTTTVTVTETTTTAAAAAAPAAAAAAPAAAAAAPAAAAAAPAAEAAAAPAAGAAAAATPGAAGGETIGGNATPTAGPNATTGNGTGTGNGTTGNGTQSIPNEPGPTSGPQTTTTASQGVPMPMLVIGALAVIGAIAAIATRLTSKDGE